MDRKRTQDGHPVIEEATYKGHGVRVVTGWDGIEDNYVVHLYIAPPGGPEIRVYQPPRRENFLDDALNLAFADAKAEIDQLAP